MSGHRGKRLGRIFLELGLIDGAQEKGAVDYAKKHGVPFGQACVRMGFVNEDTVVHGLSLQLGAPACSLKGVSVPDAVKALVPTRLAEKERIVPLSFIPAGPGAKVGTLVIAISRPMNLMEMDELAFMTGCRISPVIASDTDIDAALKRVYGVEVAGPGKAPQMGELEEGEEMQVVQSPLDFLPSVQFPRR